MGAFRDSRFECPACGARHPWVPQLAGRRMRCRCGAGVPVPQEDPSGDPVERESEFLPPADFLPFADDDADEVTSGERPGQAEEYDLSPHPHTYASEKRRWGPWVVLVVLAAGIAVGTTWYFRRAAEHSKRELRERGDDAEVQRLCREYHDFEIQQWMRTNPRHVLQGIDADIARKMADELYGRGAQRVIAFGEAISGWLAIELPEDQGQRKSLFEWAANWQEGLGRRGAADVGQHYILLKMPDPGPTGGI